MKISQHPLLSGSTCERLGLMQFTVPDLVEHVQHGPLSKEQLLSRYDDVFNWSVESVPGEVHFELDESASRNVPITMKMAVKAQLDKYEADGHMISVTEPTDWISNMVIVRVCIDPKHLNQALKRSHYIMPSFPLTLQASC